MKQFKVYFKDSNIKERTRIINAFNKLPEEARDYLLKHDIVLIKNPKDALAFVLGKKQITKSDIIIILNPEIWNLNDKGFLYVIAHEITHPYLGHKKMTKENEKEAHKLTREWMKKMLKN